MLSDAVKLLKLAVGLCFCLVGAAMQLSAMLVLAVQDSLNMGRMNLWFCWHGWTKQVCAELEFTMLSNLLVPTQGIEPRLTAPKAIVLPLDDMGLKTLVGSARLGKALHLFSSLSNAVFIVKVVLCLCFVGKCQHYNAVLRCSGQHCVIQQPFDWPRNLLM